jgi:hypothetical protein
MSKNIISDLDLKIYGWERRINQIEEDIFILNKSKVEYENILCGLKEKKLRGEE